MEFERRGDQQGEVVVPTALRGSCRGRSWSAACAGGGAPVRLGPELGPKGRGRANSKVDLASVATSCVQALGAGRGASAHSGLDLAGLLLQMRAPCGGEGGREGLSLLSSAVRDEDA